MSENNSSSGCSSGCLNIIIFIFVIGALWWGVPTPWGLFELDIFPPAIRLT